MDWGSARPPIPLDESRSTKYPTINPYRVSGRSMVSFGGLFGVVLGHGCHDPLSVLFSFQLSHSHPMLPFYFISNFAEYSCLIVGRCVQCYFAFWLTFYLSFFNLQGILGTTNWAATKRVVFVNNCSTIHTGKCMDIVIYIFTVYLPLISPWFLLSLHILVSLSITFFNRKG